MPATLYPRNTPATLDPALFAAPPAEYRGAPFWSWNCTLDRARLLEQIDSLKAMGMGGFHMHSRVGLATEYLGEEFMGHIKACVEKARQEHMLAWLYDEDRWPSGFAGSLVTRDPRFQAKQLLVTCKERVEAGSPPFVAGPPTLLARYAVRLDQGLLAGYRRLAAGESAAAGEREWRAFLRTAWTNPWFNDFTYVDSLKPEAIQRFLAITHERYASAVGKDFGGVVPAIFTDEPAFEPFRPLASADAADDVLMSWTDDFVDTYRSQWKEDLLDQLPELIWQLPEGRASRARWRYHDHNTERFAAAFADTIGAWCDRHGLLFTGHMMEEGSLQSQTRMIGEAMRSYRGFSLPGIDMLCDSMELTTAKQAQSAARQFGRPGVMSELYGVTGWDFDFTGHKRQGDWQAALGITVRVPHLSWVSMGGEAKRDYPAALDEHSPWYREYPLVENHFARLNTALTRGRAVVRVGVIHPIESYWLAWGPSDQTQLEREARDQAFGDLTRWLLHELIDFDFIAESLLPRLNPPPAGATVTAAASELAVGAMAYAVIVVPGMRTIRSSTLDRLETLVAAGGTVIFAGEIPSLVDAEPSRRAQALAARCPCAAAAKTAVVQALAPWREVTITARWGADALVHQLRQDGPARWLFICNTNRDQGCGVNLTLRGQWELVTWDTIAGTQEAYAGWAAGSDTGLSLHLPPAGHRLLRLTPTTSIPTPVAAPAVTWKEARRLDDPVPVTLAEPNVLLLDQAEFRVDGGAWEGREEILRIGQRVRAQLGMPPQGGGMAQPWVHPPEPPTHRLGLRLTIDARVAVARPRLALEGLATARLSLDGVAVAITPDGWWVDRAIQLQSLPDLAPGRHVLEVELPFGRATPCEWIYLLGDFGVEVHGRHARLSAPVRELAWGDWTRQGLPFYAGNVTYHCRLAGSASPSRLHIPHFKAPLITAAVDGQRLGAIAFPPYQIDLPSTAAGEQRLDLTAFGSRVNAFTCVHHTNHLLRWVGPDAWRSRGDDWSYEYQLRACGILVAPQLLTPEVPVVSSGHQPIHQ